MDLSIHIIVQNHNKCTLVFHSKFMSIKSSALSKRNIEQQNLAKSHPSLNRRHHFCCLDAFERYSKQTGAAGVNQKSENFPRLLLSQKKIVQTGTIMVQNQLNILLQIFSIATAQHEQSLATDIQQYSCIHRLRAFR